MLSRTVLLSDGGIHQMVWKATLEGCSHWSTGDLTGGGMLMQVVLAGPTGPPVQCTTWLHQSHRKMVCCWFDVLEVG